MCCVVESVAQRGNQSVYVDGRDLHALYTVQEAPVPLFRLGLLYEIKGDSLVGLPLSGTSKSVPPLEKARGDSLGSPQT